MSINPKSFTSASVFPVKIVSDNDIVNSVRSHRIKPIHIQLNPTNRCPLHCSFCSCKNREKGEELTYCKAYDILSRFSTLGTKAVTITGGGDPLAHPDINQIIELCNSLKIDVGLVTNAVLLDRLKFNSPLKWCRISVSSEYSISDRTIDIIKNNQHVDWAFSYVLVNGKFNNISEVVSLANSLRFTHVRIVDDILDTLPSSMNLVKQKIKDDNIDDSLVIYQGRKNYSSGSPKCFSSLIKPNIGPDGNIYPCCGLQYALDKPSFSFDPKFSMGDNIEKIWEDQKYFDGSICSKCYYSDYNNLLNVLWESNNIQHNNFI